MRNRHAQYKGDANLQAAHARFPFIVTWDDHEVENALAHDNDWRRRRSAACTSARCRASRERRFSSGSHTTS